MKLELERHAPPGLELRSEIKAYIWGMSLSVIFSLSFLIRLMNAVTGLYTWDYTGTKRILRPDAVMPDMVHVLDYALVGFLIVAIAMLGFILYHYLYHRQGSKSIYLMRRLPNRWELHRRCLTLPLVAIGLCVLSAAILFFIYFGIYMLATPRECLTPGQWQRIWSVLS